MGETSAYRGESTSASGSEALYKSIELTGESAKGWDEAVKLCVREAAETVRAISEVDIREMKGIVRDGKVASFSVRCRIIFRVDDSLRGH